MITKQHSARNIAFIIISVALGAMIFTSRLSLSVRSISLVIGLLLILLTVPFNTILKTFQQHPVARAAALLFCCFVVGAFYGNTPEYERLHLLKLYSPLLWIGLLIAFFQTALPTKFARQKTHLYVAIFVHGTVLVTFLGCLNHWQIVNVSELIHSRLTTDPPEYPFGTFCFSLSFAAYLSIQKMKYASTATKRIIYLLYFLFLTYFIFFINHERTAYILYSLLIVFYGYQHARFLGSLVMAIFVSLIFFLANHSSQTFHHRTNEAVHDIKQYQHGNPISSTGLRLFFIKETIKLWEKKPLFGYGTGSFKSTYLTIDGYTMNGSKNTPEAPLDQPHNEYVHILIQLGLFGFAFFLWLLFEETRQSFTLPCFDKQCAQALILCFTVGALDTSLFFYATSMTDYFFFTALFFSSSKTRHPSIIGSDLVKK